MTEQKRPIIVIDAINIFLRHYLVNPSLSGKSEPIGGVVGFLRFLNNLVETWAPQKLIVVWETGGGSARRRKIYPLYKANRKVRKNVLPKVLRENASMKDLLKDDTETKVKQLSLLYQILKKTPVNQIFIKETECDDVIAYLIKYKFKQQKDVTKIVVSNDKDFYQLLAEDSVKIFDPARKIIIDQSYVLKEFGISPNNFCLARTFAGDPSDNISGVPSVGLKTVLKHFPAFASPDKDLSIPDIMAESKRLLEPLKDSKKKKQNKALYSISQCEEILKRNWKLMYFSSNNLAASQIQKIESSVDDFEPKLDKLELVKILVKEQLNISFDFDELCSNFKKYLLFT